MVFLHHGDETLAAISENQRVQDDFSFAPALPQPQLLQPTSLGAASRAVAGVVAGATIFSAAVDRSSNSSATITL
uniref:Uncharacterized protein n=1 Tax=Cucumis melo TaxID=3656 RepID=A0A9I9D8L0_CUCME